MKIVHIIPGFHVGGGQLLAIRLARESARQSEDAQVFIISLYGPLDTVVYDEAMSSGATVIALDKKTGFDIKLLLKIYQTFRKIKPDVIHTHLSGLRYAFFAALFFSKSAKIHTVHNMAEHEASSVVRILHKIAFKAFGWKPVALSNLVHDSIRAVYGVRPPIVNNGVEIDEVVDERSKECCRERCNLPLKGYLIISIGRLITQKNQLLLLDVFQKIVSECEGVHLLIVGEDPTDGSYRKLMTDKISGFSEKIQHSIHLLGNLKTVPELLKASDLFMLTSDWEGVPLTLLEAMGYGVPTVCTSVGGVPDIIRSGVDGQLAPPGNSDLIASAALQVIRNPQLAQTLASNAKDKFESEYTIACATRNYLALYKEIIK